MIGALSSGCREDEKAAQLCSPTALEFCRLSEGFANPYENQLGLLDWPQTLRKASLELAGRLPSAVELQVTQDLGQDGLLASLAVMLREPAFLQRVTELYNDLLLTDKYLGRDHAMALLSEDDYPNLHWYRAEAGDVDALQVQTNDSIAREPLALIAYVVEHELPFSEILTADYTMANAYSARSFIGYKSLPLSVGDRPEAYRPVRFPGIPHAGILTSPMFLNRFPTTDTNRNRHRAKTLYQLFLASDVQALADRPIDADDSGTENPTRYDPTCTTCHAVLDPVAATFAHWSDKGVYDANKRWPEEMRPPGFAGEALPTELRARGVQWLAKRLAAHPRFATAIVQTAFSGLTGLKVLQQADWGDASDPLYPYRVQAQRVQQWFLQQLEQRFIAANANFKVLAEEIVLTPYFRAADAKTALSPEQAAELSTFATARLLSPEQLSRKLRAVSGQAWQRRNGEVDLLLEDYRLFYGGIDSDLVTKRIAEPNGVMTSIAQRMANEMACSLVPAELARPADQRLLLGSFDADALQAEASGAPTPAALGMIGETAATLHAQLLGENLAAGDTELAATTDLFAKAWALGRQQIAQGSVPASLPEACRSTLPSGQRPSDDSDYTVRAWMAVISVLLSDYRFLYE